MGAAYRHYDHHPRQWALAWVDQEERRVELSFSTLATESVQASSVDEAVGHLGLR